MRIEELEFNDWHVGAAYSSQRQFGQVRFCRAVPESHARRHTVWNIWPHEPASFTTSSARFSVQIEQSEFADWTHVGTTPVMKNSPWLRRVGILDGGAVLDSWDPGLFGRVIFLSG